jgi:hypothetical protein
MKSREYIWVKYKVPLKFYRQVKENYRREQQRKKRREQND